MSRTIDDVEFPATIGGKPVVIGFYRASGPFGFLSNLYLRPVEFEGRTFECSEYAYQYAKPADEKVRDYLMLAPTPSLCAQVAHSLFVWQVRSDWSQIKVDRMRRVLHAKFTQHPDLCEQLLATGRARLVEESKMDAFWGLGAKGRGKNMLGALLMDLREQLRNSRTV